jgi:hypothetical protein
MSIQLSLCYWHDTEGRATQTNHGGNVTDDNTQKAQEGADGVTVSRLDGVAARSGA